MSSRLECTLKPDNADHAEIAIRISKLSKVYQIYNRPVDRLKQSSLPRLTSILGLKLKPYYREFLALNDVSFDVKKGETIGVIGRNGAGKSTLLQIICGTLFPSSGDVEVNGRVAALLELGSGFNPEFTGRENVYMNAAVLGLDYEEVDCKYDAIVEFADIGEFIEQPVKTYSSGMLVRLAFSVIANVDANILIIDEALAVGDVFFTQKCMRFLREFQKRGTLIFVSHDTSSVINLCDKAIWLHEGEVADIGPAKSVCYKYLKSVLQDSYGNNYTLKDVKASENEQIETSDIEEPNLKYPHKYTQLMSVRDNQQESNGWQTGSAEITNISIRQYSENIQNIFRGGERVVLNIHAKAYKKIEKPILGFLVRDKLGQDLFGENTLSYTEFNPITVDPGENITGEFVFRMPMLPNGSYSVMCSVAEGTLENNIQHHWLHEAIIIHVESSTVRWGLMGISFENVELKNDR